MMVEVLETVANDKVLASDGDGVIIKMTAKPNGEEERKKLDEVGCKIREYLIATFATEASWFHVNEKNVGIFERSLFDVLVAMYNLDQGSELCGKWRGTCFNYFYQLLQSVCPNYTSEQPEVYRMAGVKLLQESDEAVHACYKFVEPIFSKLDSTRPDEIIAAIVPGSVCGGIKREYPNAVIKEDSNFSPSTIFM